MLYKYVHNKRKNLNDKGFVYDEKLMQLYFNVHILEDRGVLKCSGNDVKYY